MQGMAVGDGRVPSRRPVRLAETSQPRYGAPVHWVRPNMPTQNSATLKEHSTPGPATRPTGAWMPMAYAWGTVALLAAGCAMTPSVMLTEFGNESAVVRVGYGPFGPSVEVAEASAGLVARDYCESLGKTYELISLKREPQDDDGGEYVLLYACERADERLVDRRRAGSSDTEGLREVGLPMIETSHAEARRHRR